MANIDLLTIKKLRDETSASIADCRRALDESNGNYDQAMEWLKKRAAEIAAKKADRETAEGIIEPYIHQGGKVGVLVQLSCETDFVARNDAFKGLAHEIALQAAAMNPEYIRPEDVPSEIVEKEKEIYREQLLKEGKSAEMIEKILPGKIEKYYESVCLMKQIFVKDDKKKIEDLMSEAVTKLGENIRIERFNRFSL